MKKVFLLGLSLILILSGCSNKLFQKNIETEDQINKEVGQEVNQEVGQEINQANVQETQSQEQIISVDGLKISDLKTGDKIGDYTIKEIKGTLCQSDCKIDPDLSGSISFEDEYNITGKFRYNPDYPLKISFITNIDSKIPELKSNSDKKVIELSAASNPSILLMNKELNDGDFSIITKDLPGFADFIKEKDSSFINNSENFSGLFDQEVTIKIKNYKTSLLAAGEAGPEAELVKIVKATNQTSNTKDQKECKELSSVVYSYPVAWGECSNYPSNREVAFETDYPKYKVYLVLSLADTTKEQYDRSMAAALKGTYELDNGTGRFYEVAQGGAVMGGYIFTAGKYYSFQYSITSNQPKISDGIAKIDNNVTTADMLNILKSMKIIIK